MIALTFALLQAGFLNCSGSLGGSGGFKSIASSNSIGKGGSGGNGNNGGGYSGKVSYLFYAQQPLCTATPLAEDARIDLVGGIYYSEENMCSSQSPTQTVNPSVNAYDPYYLIHGERVYFRNDGQTQLPPGRRVVTYALCSNAAHKTDAVIRVEQTWNSKLIQWDTVVKGQLIRGGPAGEVSFHEETGRLADADANDTVVWGDLMAAGENSTTNSFQIRIFNFGNAFKTSGEIVLTGPGPQTLSAECYNLR